MLPQQDLPSGDELPDVDADIEALLEEDEDEEGSKIQVQFAKIIISSYASQFGYV